MDNLCQWADCENKIFDSPESLTLHILTEHSNQKTEKGFLCEWRNCSRKGQELSTRTNFVTHLRSHTGERPYKCAICSQSFTRSEALTKHTKNQHPESYATEQLNQQQSNSTAGASKAKKQPPAAAPLSETALEYRDKCRFLHLKMRYLYQEKVELQQELNQVKKEVKRFQTLRCLLLDAVQRTIPKLVDEEEVYFSDESQFK